MGKVIIKLAICDQKQIKSEKLTQVRNLYEPSAKAKPKLPSIAIESFDVERYTIEGKNLQCKNQNSDQNLLFQVFEDNGQVSLHPTSYSLFSSDKCMPNNGNGRYQRACQVTSCSHGVTCTLKVRPDQCLISRSAFRDRKNKPICLQKQLEIHSKR